LDEEVEVSVPTLRFKPLNELFDNDIASIAKYKINKKKLQICKFVLLIKKIFKIFKTLITTLLISSNDNNDRITDDGIVSMTEGKNDRKIKMKYLKKRMRIN